MDHTECGVCYTNIPTCHYTCGHSFCISCTKQWFIKCDTPSCPYCRKSIYFKGMTKKIKEWEEERVENFFQHAFSTVVEDIFETMEQDDDKSEFSLNFAFYELQLIEERVNKLRGLGAWLTDSVDEDQIELIMNDITVPIVIVSGPRVFYTITNQSLPNISHHKNTNSKITGFRKNSRKKTNSFHLEELDDIVICF